MKIITIIFFILILNTQQQNSSFSLVNDPPRCENREGYYCMNGHTCNQTSSTCPCSEDWTDWNCGELACAKNSHGKENGLCQCKDGWDGMTCRNCKNNTVCKQLYAGKNGTTRCDDSFYDYGFHKQYSCLVTQFSIPVDLQLEALIYCDPIQNKSQEHTCNVQVFTQDGDFQYPPGTLRQIFWCNSWECKERVFENDHGEVIIRRRCEKSFCRCTEKFTCPPLMRIALMRLRGWMRFDCKNNTNHCELFQNDVGNLVDLNCTSSECIFIPENGTGPSTPDPIRPQPRDLGSMFIVIYSSAGFFFLLTVFLLVFFIYTRFTNVIIFNHWKKMETCGAQMLEFQNIHYSVTPNLLSGKKLKILQNISGSIAAGSFVAIMGESGAGKSSFLDILGNRKKSGKKKGIVKYGGNLLNPGFSRISGYVSQEPQLMGNMTVKECLMFAANMRLPEKVAFLEKTSRVASVLKALDIEKIANSKIGSMFSRSISGGEKKRVALGMELVVNPSLLLLDEPTSGLDSFNALKIMRDLKKRTENKKTVIFSIHQPSSAIFDLFDILILLKNGKLVYFGPAKFAVPHFKKLNLGGEFTNKAHHSPGDILIDLLHDLSPEATNKLMEDLQMEKNTGVVEDSEYQMSTDKKATTEIEDEENVKESFKQPFPWNPYVVSFFQQFKVLSKRAFKNFLFNPFLMPAHFIICILIGLILGWVYFQQPLNLEGTQNRVGVIFFCMFVLALGAMSSIELFIDERRVFIREHANSYYSIFAYFYSKILFDVIPLRVLPPILMSAIMYPMIGFDMNPLNFMWFLVIVVSFNIACGGICLVIGSAFSTVTFANLVSLFVILYSVLFGGYLINNEGSGIFKYFSLMQYTMEALLVNELSGKIILFDPPSSDPLELRVTGEFILRDIFNMNELNFGRNVGIIFGSGAILIILAGVILWFSSEEKR